MDKSNDLRTALSCDLVKKTLSTLHYFDSFLGNVIIYSHPINFHLIWSII